MSRSPFLKRLSDVIGMRNLPVKRNTRSSSPEMRLDDPRFHLIRHGGKNLSPQGTAQVLATCCRSPQTNPKQNQTRPAEQLRICPQIRRLAVQH